MGTSEPLDGNVPLLSAELPSRNKVTSSKKVMSRLWMHNSKQVKERGPTKPKYEQDADKVASMQVHLTDTMETADSMRIYIVSEDELLNVREIVLIEFLNFHYKQVEFLLSQIEVVRSYIDLIESQSPAPLHEHETRNYKNMLKGTHEFLLQGSGILSKDRQRITREIKLVDALFWALVFPFIKGYHRHSLPARQIDLQRMLAMLICDTFKENGSNQIYVAKRKYENSAVFTDLLPALLNRARSDSEQRADSKVTSGKEVSYSWMQEMISELGQELGMDKVMTELVLNNYEVLNGYINNSVIKTFVELNFSKGPSAQFVDFLKTLASCKGKRISENQERLLRAMLSVEGCERSFLNRIV